MSYRAPNRMILDVMETLGYLLKLCSLGRNLIRAVERCIKREKRGREREGCRKFERERREKRKKGEKRKKRENFVKSLKLREKLQILD